MTKTWFTVLAVALALTPATLHAKEPTEFLTLPPTDIKPQPFPLDTKAPPPSLPPQGVVPAPGGACAPACSPCPAPCHACGLGSGRLRQMMPCGHHEHTGLEKLKEWLLFRPCECTPWECCFCLRPYPPNYLYFMYLGCQEHDCGGCCKGAAGCGCKTCGPCGK